MLGLHRKEWIAVCALLAGLLLVASLAYFSPKPQRTPRLAKPAPAVQVMIIAPSPLSVTIRSQGTVAPKREIDLVSQVAGRVIATAGQYANGGFFKAGEILVQIEPEDYELSVTRARAQVAKAVEQVAIEQGRSRQAKREWRDLRDREANALFLREPQLNAAKAALASAQADVKRAQLNLARTGISAPFRGRIRHTFSDLGQYVNAGARIAKVYSTDLVEVRLPLSDRDAALVELPVNFEDHLTTRYPQVTLRNSVGAEVYEWRGKIVRTEASIDIKSRMTYAVAEVENPFKSDPSGARPPLNIGLFVEADIIGKIIADAVVIPKTAVYRGNEILVLNQENEVRYQSVLVIQTATDSITAVGIPRGTRIVSSRLPLAIAGMKVSPTQAVVLESKVFSTETPLL